MTASIGVVMISPERPARDIHQIVEAIVEIAAAAAAHHLGEAVAGVGDELDAAAVLAELTRRSQTRLQAAGARNETTAVPPAVETTRCGAIASSVGAS